MDWMRALNGFELECLQLFDGDARAYAEHLYADYLAGFVVVEYNAGLHFFGFYDARFVKA